jgi:CheY-like chemotaxis protein
MKKSLKIHDDSSSDADPDNTVELIRPPAPDSDPEVHSVHLVDHDSDALLYLFDFLSNAGFHVSASSNTVDALDYVTRSHPELLIAEIEMSEMSGLELSQRAKEVSPATRIILTSTSALRPVHDEVLRRTGADLVLKPFSGIVLLRAVQRVFGTA